MIELGIIVAILIRCYLMGVPDDVAGEDCNFDDGLAAVEGYGPTDGDVT